MPLRHQDTRQLSPLTMSLASYSVGCCAIAADGVTYHGEWGTGEGAVVPFSVANELVVRCGKCARLVILPSCFAFASFAQHAQTHVRQMDPRNRLLRQPRIDNCFPTANSDINALLHDERVEQVRCGPLAMAS